MQTNPKQILASVIDSFGMTPQEVVGLLENLKADYYIRMNTSIAPNGTTPLTFPIGGTIYNKSWTQEVEPKIVEVKQASLFERKNKLKKKRKKYEISEERRQELREWAKKMAQSRKLKNTEKKHITIPSKGETSLKDWADNLIMKNKIKQRLYNGLIKLHNRGFYLEDTHQQAFLDVENIGMDSWREFLKLRFEHFSKL